VEKEVFVVLKILPGMLITALLGGLVHGISGFGFNMVFMAVMQYFMPYTALLSLTSILALALVAVNAFVYRKNIVWRWLPLPLLINFVFTLGALRFLNYTMGFPYWHKLLGLMFIVLSIYLFFWQRNIQIRPTLGNMILFCGAGGIMGGLFGVGAPMPVLYFLAIADSKERYLSTAQMFLFINMSYDFAGRCWNGMVTVATLQYAAVGIGAVLLGLWVGNRIFRQVDADLLKKFVYGVMFVDGWYMLLFR